MHKLAHTFTATHCGHTYAGVEGAAALEAHMRTAHDVRGLLPGSNTQDRVRAAGGYSTRPIGNAPGWRNGKIQEPTPWKAPRPSAGGLEKVLRDADAGKYNLTYRYAGGTYAESVPMLVHPAPGELEEWAS